MAKRIIWAREAVSDRIQILDYWYDRLGSKDYSIKLDKMFRETVRLLSNFSNMIVYLAQKYFINSFVFFVGLSIFPLFYFEETTNLISKTIFLGGLLGAIYTFYDFKKRHLWPLYDNLTYPKYLLLLTFFISLQIFSVIINLIF